MSWSVIYKPLEAKATLEMQGASRGLGEWLSILSVQKPCIADGAEHLHGSVGPNLSPKTWVGDPEVTKG